MSDRSDASARERRGHPLLRAAWIALATVVVAVALGVVMTRVTASDRVCASCHEMRPSVVAWRTSAHTRVACPACHETPRPWYAFPETLFGRAGMLARDMAARNVARADETTGAPADITLEVPDSACLRCHDLSRVVTVRDGITIEHNEHAERNGNCLSCHLSVGHPGSADQALLLMDRCFTCHGSSSTAKAPGACGVCHPKSFDKRPKSHFDSWRTRHGKTAKTERRQCDMCHTDRFCRDCHRLDMPHPQGWVGGQVNHVAAGTRDWRVCETCHGQGPDLCNKCHHKQYSSTGVQWRNQHPSAVRARSSSGCMRCHERAYCSYCHTSASMS